MFLDVVASTERLATMGDRPWLSLLNRLLGDIRQEVERYGGTVVKGTGDGLVATFRGAAAAVSSALAALSAADVHGIEVRCGLHTGEIERLPGDIGGLAVHISQRVCAYAPPGTVLMSRTTADVVAGSGLHLTPGIQVPLRGVPGEWELFGARSHP
jgi:class 3 adenylate cyclase